MSLRGIPTSYEAAIRMLGAKTERLVARKTHLLHEHPRLPDRSVALVHWEISIVRWFPDGAIELYSYPSTTTQFRQNLALRTTPWRVGTERGHGYVYGHSQRYHFLRGTYARLNPDGTTDAAPAPRRGPRAPHRQPCSCATCPHLRRAWQREQAQLAAVCVQGGRWTDFD